MTFLDTSIRVAHVLLAGTWAGGALFMAGAVVPAARAGRLDADALSWVTRRFSRLTMAAAAVLFVTGGHLAGTSYGGGALTGTGRGHLVIAMTVLWAVLAGVLHFGTRSLNRGLDGGDARAAADASRGWFLAAGVVAVLLLVVAGVL